MTLAKSLATGCAAAFLLFGSGLSAEAVVYTASNETSGNRVIVFDLDKRSGRLSEIDSFDTQGTGTGAPIGNQAAIATDASDRWLFVTNAGDGSITSFRLQPQGLEFVNRIDSGGFSPISVTVFGTLVYVLNEGSGDDADPPEFRYDNISGFRFDVGGVLVPIAGSTRVIDATRLTSPAQVGFNKSGTVLLITEKATDTLTTFLMQPDDTPAATPLKRPSAVPTPFGFEFGDRDFVFVTEANRGGPGVTASYRIDRGTGAVSSLVDLVLMGDATCWTALSSDQTVGYSTNTGSDSLSLYRINFNGTMEPFFNQPLRQVRSGGAAPRDAVVTQDNRFLVVLNNGSGGLQAFRIVFDGRIIPSGPPAPVPASATGLVSR